MISQRKRPKAYRAELLSLWKFVEKVYYAIKVARFWYTDAQKTVKWNRRVENCYRPFSGIVRMYHFTRGIFRDRGKSIMMLDCCQRLTRIISRMTSNRANRLHPADMWAIRTISKRYLTFWHMRYDILWFFFSLLFGSTTFTRYVGEMKNENDIFLLLLLTRMRGRRNISGRMRSD